MSRLDLSVVIPTYNRAEVLRESVPALAAQRSACFSFEVIFVDDGSTDDTPEILRQAEQANPTVFRYVRAPHSGSPAMPRNIGIRAACGNALLLLDDDVIPDPDLVAAHCRFHRNNPAANTGALGELYLPPHVEADPMSLFHSFPYASLPENKPLEFYHFWTCNLSFKREFMLAHGMFDEDPQLHPVEDMECGYRMVVQGGLQLMLLREARGQHVHKMKPEWVARKGLRTGEAQWAVTQKISDVRLKTWLRLLTNDLPAPERAARLLKRGVLRLADNPLTMAVLRALGAERSRRSRVTDVYYYLIFRRNILQGYKRAAEMRCV